jgi:hypothetical protein
VHELRHPNRGSLARHLTWLPSKPSKLLDPKELGDLYRRHTRHTGQLTNESADEWALRIRKRVKLETHLSLGAGGELELGEVITEVFKPEDKAIFAIHVRGTYSHYDTIGPHRELPSRVAKKGAVRI